jgi:hypothetical protein
VMTNDRFSLMHLKIKILRNTQQKWEANIHALSGIRTRVIRKIGIDTCYPSLGCVSTNRDESSPVHSGLRVTGAAQRLSLVQSSPRESE